ncbi:metallophosphoesterase family protein [Pedobacter sp.]|uniref:metallophosphoesterase family protein n=1 Tax=Pedobacter sp. TaxID=1411316 RepID=UPI00396CEED1
MKSKILFLLLLTGSVILLSFIREGKTLPVLSKKDFNIAVISDLNSGYGSTSYHDDVYTALKELKTLKPDMILCGGDMVAGQKATLTEANLQAMWKSFDTNVFAKIKAMKVPFAFTVGNHDASPNFTKDREVASRYWLSKKDSLGLDFISDENYPFYFSYANNRVFFISWDASGAQIKPEVLNWMQEQLNSKAAKTAKLRIVLGHLPLYAIVSSKNKAGEVLASTGMLEEMFEQHNVDLYISGHQHAYYPSRRKTLRLLNAGCIGDGPRPFINNPEPAKRAYTIIKVPQKQANKFTYQTFIPAQNSTIEIKNLPDSIIGFNGISRLDQY